MLIGLKNEKSRQGEVTDTHVFDHVPEQLLRKKTTFKKEDNFQRVARTCKSHPKWMTVA